MRYMLLLYMEDRPSPDSPEGSELFSKVRAFHRHCRDQGVLVDSAPLFDPSNATSVRIREGRVLHTDGPFAETTEWLGGYFTLDCRDQRHALELAALCPTANHGTVEVRPIIDVGVETPADGQ